MTGPSPGIVGACIADDPSGLVLWWESPRPLRFAATSAVGGGLAEGTWFVNLTVPADYARTDPADHLAEVANRVGLRGPGVGMLTAADVRRHVHRIDGGVEVLATVGLGWPTWAADLAPDAAPGIGTVNLFVLVPARVGDAALVNLVGTVTEAKVQALHDLGVDGTGTASDAVAVACWAPVDGDDRIVDPFGGPRSLWGARAARAVYAAVWEGALDDERAAVAAGYHRAPRRPGRLSPGATGGLSVPGAPRTGR